jgi:hypothetical protein
MKKIIGITAILTAIAGVGAFLWNYFTKEA